MKQDISYTAIVLKQQSIEGLLENIKPFIPENWKIDIGSMMIKNGGLDIDDYRVKYIGTDQTVKIVAVGWNDAYLAVKVIPNIETNNTTSQIQVARSNDYLNESNKYQYFTPIKNWFPITKNKQITLNGVVEEFPL